MPLTGEEAPLNVSLPDGAFDEQTLTLLKDGHHAEAVRRAAQLFQIEVQRMADRPDLEGKTLLEQAFSEQRPLLVFGPLDTQLQKDRHQGFRSLVVGLHRAVRNVLTHDPNFRIERDEALAWLVFINLLTQWLRTAYRVDTAAEGDASESSDAPS